MKAARLLTLLLAIVITLTAMAMASAAAWDRGGTWVDRMLLVALSVVICAGTHLIPALSKRKLAWLLWSGCLLATVYSQLSFLTHASIRAGDDRAQHSVQVQGAELQIITVREALAGIVARPLAVVAGEIAVTEDWQQRNALKLELAEAKRAAALRDELVKLSSAATNAKVMTAPDPVTNRIAAVTGSSEEGISLLIGLGLSILMELVGVLLWCEVLRVPLDAPAVASAQAKNESDPIVDLKSAIQSGHCKETVAGIRGYLGCSQARAMEIRRALIS
jgi:hypothetical protein